MSEKPEPSIDRGPLRFNAISQRWEIGGAITGTLLHEITSGDVIFVDVRGEMRLTRIEYDHGYVSIDGYRLADGIEAALPNG